MTISEVKSIVNSDLSDYVKEADLINLIAKDERMVYIINNAHHTTKSQENFDPHEASRVRCDLCSYEWIAVRPAGLDKLECPNCGNVSYFENIPD